MSSGIPFSKLLLWHLLTGAASKCGVALQATLLFDMAGFLWPLTWTRYSCRLLRMTTRRLVARRSRDNNNNNEVRSSAEASGGPPSASRGGTDRFGSALQPRQCVLSSVSNRLLLSFLSQLACDCLQWKYAIVAAYGTYP